MKHTIFFLIFLTFNYASSAYASATWQTPTVQSSLYEKWRKDWGNYEWGNNAIGNKSYAFETAYVIIAMIDRGDMHGLRYLYETLQKDKEHNMAFLNGIIGEPTFEKEAIENANIKALEFLLHNGIVKIDTDQEYSLLELATQKLQESKTKQDSKAIANYEKIIKLLQELGEINECNS